VTPFLKLWMAFAAAMVTAFGLQIAYFFARAYIPAGAILASLLTCSVGLLLSGLIAALFARRWMHLEKEVEHLRPLATEFQDVKDRFLSHVSHEFRSPLATLIGYLDLLSRPAENLPKRQLTIIETMRQSAQRLKIFVDNVLDLSQLDAKLMSFQSEPIDVKGLLQEAALESHKELEAHKMKIRVQCAAHLCAFADRNAALSILQQVLANAIHFTPNGGHITLWAKESGPASILFGVTDSGIGIPRHSFERVFKKFEQVHETSKLPRKVSGTGIGLTLARRLVEAQSGKIWVQNSSRRGTTFAWTLPKAQPRAAQESLGAPASNNNRLVA
jgi:signal transduction histidine kinase